MVGQLLETKLLAPKRRQSLVSRPQLTERLSQGAASKLTLISAPAGFGKTTLLGEWLAVLPVHQQSVIGRDRRRRGTAAALTADDPIEPAIRLSIYRSDPSAQELFQAAGAVSDWPGRTYSWRRPTSSMAPWRVC